MSRLQCQLRRAVPRGVGAVREDRDPPRGTDARGARAAVAAQGRDVVRAAGSAGGGVFTVEKKQIELPSYAPIHDSVSCSLCGESVMETKARLWDGKPVCLVCVGAEHYLLDGSGISFKQT